MLTNESDGLGLAPSDFAPARLPRKMKAKRINLNARPSDWHWQARNAVTSLDALERAIVLTDAERQGVKRAIDQGLPLSITPHYLALCDPHDPHCPIRRQCVPHVDESVVVEGDLRDPLGEEAHQVAEGLVQRYPDRALLIATDRCGVYCRFCTRSRMVGNGSGVMRDAQLEGALAYLRAHPEVRDVIVSGGDPLLMATPRLEALIGAVRGIPHVETIRLATRCPVTLPQRITVELVRALRKHHPIWIMTHFNHPKELTPEADRALARLVDGGFPVMNQTVLLRTINDDAATLETLFRGLVRRRVRPYYLLQADVVRGTAHLRTKVAAGVEIMERLQGRLTGIALPKFIVDTPGGKGKVPMGPNYVVSQDADRITLRTFRGEEVTYLDPRDPRDLPVASDRRDPPAARECL
ncbi:MAG: lysine 2,3-aminomutase [Polyangiales bacterium]